MDDGKLIGLLAAGDTRALGRTIKAYTGYVRTIAHNFSRGILTDEDLDEVTADVFCKLWNARGKLNAGIGLRSYLSAIARNTVKDRFRKIKPPDEDISELELPSGSLVEDIAELGEMLSCLYEGLEKLPDGEREIFYRFYFNGERSAQIAAAKGMSKAAVDMKLSRTRKKLRSYLNERGYDHV